MQIVSYTNDGDNKLMFHLCVNIIIKRCLNKNTFFEPIIILRIKKAYSFRYSFEYLLIIEFEGTPLNE
jgi:hypothetical protein